jgi:hypothetical protein
MDPLTAYDVAKFRIAERHEQAAQERMARQGRSFAGSGEQETSIWRRWTVRQVVGRITHVNAGA